ncbi:MAG: type 1 glutamine amidotransferase [Candidatus Desantisbacteria bacterium]
MVIIIQHVPTEGPGTIAEFLQKTGRKFEVIQVYNGDLLPSNLEGISAVVIMGGPMNVYEEEKYPFLKKEDEFIRQVVQDELPFLGICLGAQLLAKACEARVEKASMEEIGFFEVSLTQEGRQDPLFKGVKSLLTVFQWHEDTFQIPKGGVLLARGLLCQNQAFRIGRNAYGLQFHPEVTYEMLEVWFEGKTTNILTEYRDRQTQYNQQADQMYANFFYNYSGVVRI